MKVEFNKKYLTIAVYAFAVIACSILFFMFIKGFGTVRGYVARVIGILAPFLYGFCIAYLINPAMVLIEKCFRQIDKKGRIKNAYRSLSITLAFLVLIAFIAVFIIIAGPQIKSSLQILYLQIQEWGPKAIAYVEGFVTNAEFAFVEEQINKYISTLSSFVINASKISLTSIWGSVKSVTTVLYNLILGFVIAVYMLAGKERFIYNIKKILFTFFSKSRASSIVNTSSKAHKIFSEYILGKIIDSVIVGILCSLGMFVLRLPFAALIGVIIGVTNIIPYFGAWFGAIIGALFILIVSPVQALIFLIFVFVLQQIDAGILSPKILGESTGISAFWVMFAILIGGGFFGIMGMFIGVPVFALIHAITVSYVDEKYKKKTANVNAVAESENE